MREVQVDLRGVEIRMAEQVLHGVQTGAGLDQMRGEAVPQRVRCGIGQIKFLACEHEQALQALPLQP